MTCHPYVNRTAAAGDLTHTKIEVEFDRSLMVADRLDPVTYDQTGHIQATLENAEVIAPFYPVVTDWQVRKALDSMVFYHHLLMARTAGEAAPAHRRPAGSRARAGAGGPGDLARTAIPAAWKAIPGSGPSTTWPGPALQFLQDFDAYRAGKAPLPEPFQYNFEGVKGAAREGLFLALKGRGPFRGLTEREFAWVLYDVGNSAFTMLSCSLVPIWFKALAVGGGARAAERQGCHRGVGPGGWPW